jgi:hypothetical protein
MDDRVVVPEVAAVRVPFRRAVRLWIGRFIVDYVETFVALIPAQALAWILTPQLNFSSVEDAKLATVAWIVQLAGPAISALVSAGRRSLITAWPSVRKWLTEG